MNRSGTVLPGTLAVVLCAAAGLPVHADDAEIAKLLSDKGVALTETKGVITKASVKAGDKLADADFAMLGKLSRLTMLDVSGGLTDDRLAMLAGLSELEYLQTNLAQVTDDGIKPLSKLKALKNLKFFHPGKQFSGAGLAHLAELPSLRSVTMAGALAFNDEGMAAVARLPHVTEFRTWHAGMTDEGVKKLKDMKSLKSLYLGQRLTYKPPACPADDTIAIVAELKTLESLQLAEARLSLKALQQLKGLPALKTLTLEGVDLPKEDVEALRKELPAVKLTWSEPNETYLKRIKALFGER